MMSGVDCRTDERSHALGESSRQTPADSQLSPISNAHSFINPFTHLLVSVRVDLQKFNVSVENTALYDNIKRIKESMGVNSGPMESLHLLHRIQAHPRIRMNFHVDTADDTLQRVMWATED